MVSDAMPTENEEDDALADEEVDKIYMEVVWFFLLFLSFLIFSFVLFCCI